ncbi:MAG: Arc family DNA-binding protein [Vogesella sp.]|uniref:Arc family DNA-binding protein n=1 Tax=Vogesella sp. TaxID=1904252 RepID=UPI0039199843
MMDAQTEIYRSQYRLPMPVANWLKTQAASNFRSVNAELIAILHEAMQRRSPRKLSAEGDSRTP